MSLDTLLEAARYIELQEQKEQHHPDIPANNMTTISPTTSAKHRPHTDLTIKNVTHILPSHLLPPAPVKETVQQHNPLPAAARQFIRNSFDIINPLIIDEASGEQKRKQPPLVFRSGTREVHNKLEKHRRAHLKECFDLLKKQLPVCADEKKTSNLSILHSALRHIQALKRRERELEHEMERLAREKISAQQRLAVLKKDISVQYDNVDFAKLLPEVPPASANEHEAPQLQTVVNERVPIPPLNRHLQVNGTREVAQPVQTTALSVLPVGYPMSQGLVLQKVALVPKGLTDLVSNPTVTHFITTPQQLNGKVVPLVNAQYVVKPVVVVSTASRSS